MNLNTQQKELVVTKEWSIARMIVLFIIVFGIGTAVLATLTFRSIRGKAQTPAAFPTPLIVSVPVPSPKTSLVEPYIRLVSLKNEYGFGTTIPVDIYVHTANQEVVEANIELQFNDDVLALASDAVESTDLFKTISVTVDEGSAHVIMFVNLELGHRSVATQKEAKAATLLFKTKALPIERTQIQIPFTVDEREKTSFLGPNARFDESENLLRSVEGVSFSISQ